MSIKGIQACSQAIPQILGISGIEIAVRGTIVEGEIERGFSHGTGWPVVDIEGSPIKYYDLFNTLISFFETNSVIKSLPDPKSKFLGWKVGSYVMYNSETIKREFWGEPRVSSTSTETTEVEGNITTQHITQKEPGKGTVKQHGKKKTKGDASKEKRKKINDTSYTDNEPMVTERSTFNSGVHSHTETKNPPIFSKKQKIAIAIGVVTALATALVCYLVQLPVWAIIVSALVDGVGAYIVSSKLYDVSICNGAGQQPGL